MVAGYKVMRTQGGGKKETKTLHMVKSNVLNLVMAVRASGVQSKERSLKVKCTLISLRGKDNTLA